MLPRFIQFLAVVLACRGLAPAQNCGTSDPTIYGEVIASGWQRSYRSGCVDGAGKTAAGTETLHLVGHKGKLYAAVGYWESPRNIWYGGKDPGTGWAQILRLDGPSASWQVDLDMTNHLRAEILKSVTFTTDGNGRALDAPVNLLLASTYESNGEQGVSLFTRNDDTAQWVKTKVIVGDTGQRGEACSVRAMAVHHDAVTGVDRLFLSVGQIGVYSGVYDPSLAGKVRWDARPEIGPLGTRPLAIVEANGSVFFSSGALVYRRVDGSSPAWVKVLDMTAMVPPGDMLPTPPGTTSLSSVGGIRALSPLPNPNGAGQSLLFMWAPGTTGSHGCMMRLDPDGNGGYTRVQEACLDTLVGEYLGASVTYAAGGYNNILPVANRLTRETNYLVGMEVAIVSHTVPIGQPGGMYAGAIYAIRDNWGAWQIAEVNGRIPASNPPLIATRSYTISPFATDRGRVVYFGGYDCDNNISNDTAWIFRAELDPVLLISAPHFPRPGPPHRAHPAEGHQDRGMKRF